MGASTVDGGQRTMSEPHADSALIAAIATPPGRGGIGIVRLSGGRLADVAQMICHTALKPRQATYTAFYAADGGAIDFGVALYFPAPHSYTGQDVLELQGHGGNAVLQMLLKRCLQLGARLAAPGEFTQRAFLNDKIDLAQAESVVDLIDASSAAAARLAMRSLSGEFSRQVAVLIDGLIYLRMLVEATLDFPDEAVDPIHHDQAASQLRELRSDLDRLFRQCRQGAVLRQGLHVVFIGQPNVGKSSLLNRLAGEEVAIVTPIAGTTRDSVRTLLHLDGVPIYVIDTAGLRATADPIEKIGIERTWAAIRQADLALVIVDATRGIAASDQAIVGQLPPELAVQVVLNKIDLVEHQPDQEAEPAEIAVSALTGAGLDVLRIRLLAAAGWQPTESIFLARQRHLDALQRCATHLQSAETLVQQAELFAEELRLAQNALSEITGEFTADDLLGEIFSRFCIGK